MKNSNDTIGNRTRDLPACERSASTNCATSSVTQINIYINKFHITVHVLVSLQLNYCSIRGGPSLWDLNACYMRSENELLFQEIL
jgi:hypothetical protein